MARANVKTEMDGSMGGRWTTREDAKASSKKIRREYDRAVVDADGHHAPECCCWDCEFDPFED